MNLAFFSTLRVDPLGSGEILIGTYTAYILVFRFLRCRRVPRTMRALFPLAVINLETLPIHGHGISPHRDDAVSSIPIIFEWVSNGSFEAIPSNPLLKQSFFPWGRPDAAIERLNCGKSEACWRPLCLLIDPKGISLQTKILSLASHGIIVAVTTIP